MSLGISSSSLALCNHHQFRLSNMKFPPGYAFSFPPSKFPQILPFPLTPVDISISNSLTHLNPPPLRFARKNRHISGEKTGKRFDPEDEGEIVDETESPWEGAVIYKRNPSITHVDYSTTLERLGLGEVSSDISKSKASVLGFRVGTEDLKDCADGTPVLVSIDVTRKKKRLRLDGIIKTAIALLCNSCCEPTAQCIFIDFSLLLSQIPIEEPEIIDIKPFLENYRGRASYRSNVKEEERRKKYHDDDDMSIDYDDRLYFPYEVKEIDISKHIRDLIHLEVTFDAVCDSNCKGICLKCGRNLNIGSCNCDQLVEERGFSPFADLKQQMQRK